MLIIIGGILILVGVYRGIGLIRINKRPRVQAEILNTYTKTGVTA